MSILLIRECVVICRQRGRPAAQGMESLHSDIISNSVFAQSPTRAGTALQGQLPCSHFVHIVHSHGRSPRLCTHKFAWSLLSHQVPWNLLAALTQGDLCSSRSTTGVAIGPASWVFTFPLEVKKLSVVHIANRPCLRIGERPILFSARG